MSTSPSRTLVPARNVTGSVCFNALPSIEVPLVDPRSSSVSESPARVSRACRRDTVGWATTRSHWSEARPITMPPLRLISLSSVSSNECRCLVESVPSKRSVTTGTIRVVVPTVAGALAWRTWNTCTARLTFFS